MTQIPLFRSTDPHTSRDAAAKVDDFRASHEARIYQAICNAQFGYTYRQIARDTGLEPVAVARRLVSMERRKLIMRKRDELTGEYLAQDGMAIWWKR